VELSSTDCAAIAQAGEAEIDLREQQVRWPGGSARFEIDPDTKHRLLGGLDEIALTLGHEHEIRAYERDRERSGPVTTSL
jgi:3-isopropylmalate/(R)-2-methylmalate dehydratase small subunit